MLREYSAEYVKDIREAIVTVTDNNRVYWNVAGEDKTFPYVVFEIRSVGGDKVITLDLWGERGGEVELSNLADLIEAYLDGLVIYNIYHASTLTSQNNLQWIADEDERIIHLNLSFDATYQS